MEQQHLLVFFVAVITIHHPMTMTMTMTMTRTMPITNRYGELGVCNDSAALLQLCVRGENFTANTSGTGVGRQRLVHCARRMLAVLEEESSTAANATDRTVQLADAARAVLEALETLPCDTLVGANEAAEAAMRLRKCLTYNVNGDADGNSFSEPLPLLNLPKVLKVLDRVQDRGGKTS